MHDGAFPAFFSNCELSSTNDESALVTCVLSMITCDSKRKAGKGSVVSATSCDLTLHMTYHCNYCACLVSYCLVSSINYLCHCVVQFTKSELHSWPNNYRLHHALENVVGLKQGAFHRLASTTRRVILWAKNCCSVPGIARKPCTSRFADFTQSHLLYKCHGLNYQ